MSKIEVKNNILSLELDWEKISADKLRRSINLFYDLSNEVASKVADKKNPVNWIVSVKGGSAYLINQLEAKNIADNKFIPQIVNAIGKGFEILEESSTEKPPFFTERALELAQELADLSRKGNGLNKIRIRVDNKPHTLTSKTVEHVDSLLGYHTKALGSIEGRLETISERGQLKVIVYDVLTDRPIQCNIDEDLREEAVKAFGKRVYVYGMIRYNKNGLPNSIRVEEIKVFQEREKLPSAFQICGILAEA